MSKNVTTIFYIAKIGEQFKKGDYIEVEGAGQKAVEAIKRKYPLSRYFIGLSGFKIDSEFRKANLGSR